MSEAFPTDQNLTLAVSVGSLHEVTIEKIVYGGEGLARLGTHALFVPFSAPGDRLRVRIVETGRNFARAVIEEILEPGSARRPPPCSHFGICGGCQLQHLNYAAQLEAKAEFVRESLRRLGGIHWTAPLATRAAAELGYRTRAELKIQRLPPGNPKLGYFQAGTHEVCEVRECPILLPAASRALQQVRDQAAALPKNATRVYLTVGDEEVFVTPATGEGARVAELDAQGTAHQYIGGLNYEFGVRSFFQGNRLLVEELVRVVIGEQRGKLAIDLYAGVGLFTLPLAQRFAQVIAVEGNRPAVQHALENARVNGLANIRHAAVSVEAWLKNHAAQQPRPDLVVLDPPRAGAGKVVIERLVTLAPPQLVYVSCDPTTLARDLKALTSNGYELTDLTVLDMFPQTFHVETVAALQRKS